MTNPTAFFYDENISDEVCSDILTVLDADMSDRYQIVRTALTEFIKQQKTFKNIQFYSVAVQICKAVNDTNDFEDVGKVVDVITRFFGDKQELYESIAATVIPVNVYSGSEDTLPEIFERINSKGTPLDQYEIYAAAWPVNEKFYINNPEVIEYIIKKYDTLVEAGFTIHGYNREELRHERKVNAFEYLFGLSRYLVNNFNILSFGKNISDDTVNPLAFELVNACLNDTDKIRILYKNFEQIDINEFENALVKVINFVAESISVITKFKGNAHNKNKIFHSKYQIMSMISTSFKEMYPSGDYSKTDSSWTDKKQKIAKNLVQYYAYDIITNYWSEGGTNKIHSAAKPNRYMSDISGRAWSVALDGFFERSMQRSERKNVANPRSEEYVLLNCIYVKTFSAMDQLSVDKFDVEHIAPKDQMRKLIDACNGDGLPVSCIANLCYLPESANRSKGAKNFYQDKKYLTYINLAEVESKYSFTEEEDLEWMDMPYEKPEDFAVLREYYSDYCSKRYEKMKRLFCDSLGIPYVSSEEIEEEHSNKMVIPPKSDDGEKYSTIKFADKCVLRLAASVGEDLIKLSRGSFKTRSGEYGFAVTTSKMYKHGKREKYWFAYRRTDTIAECREKYYIFGCKDETTMLKFPVSLIEENLDKLRFSTDDEGNITHWHIVFFKDSDGHMTWMFSNPKVKEINVDEYVMK